MSFDLNLSNLGKPKEESEEKAKPYVKPDYMYKTNEEVFRFLRTGARIIGEPGASLTWGIDGNRALESLTYGLEGEKQTGDILEEFINTHPGAFVFHSLSWPESNGDTDHILVYKNLVVVIDSKRWKGQRKYSVNAKGAIFRGTVPFEEGRVHIGSALKVWRRKLPENVKVVGVVAIAQEKIFVVRDRNWHTAPYRLVEAEKLAEYLEQLTVKYKAKPPTAGSVLLTLGHLVVKPRRMEKIKF
jgi:hypothetical protein